MEKDSNNSENDGVSASTYSSFPPDMIIPRERARQNIAKQFNLWSSEPDEAFSRMVMIAQRVFRTSIAALGFLGEKEHFFPARIGFDLPATPREETICTLSYLDETAKTFIIPDTLENPWTKSLAIVNNLPNFRFYAAASIVLDGVKVGTFCICDSKPRYLRERDVLLLTDMAACISEMLTLRSRRWIQVHLNGISQSTAILSSIKGPLEDVSTDVGQIHQLVDEIDNCYCPFPSSTNGHWGVEDGHSLPSESSVDDLSVEQTQVRSRSIQRNLSQDTTFSGSDNSHANTGSVTQNHFLSSRSSVRKSHRRFTGDCTTAPPVATLNKLQEVAEYLREDVNCLGHAIDYAIQRMLEINLRKSPVGFGSSSVVSSPRLAASKIGRYADDDSNSTSDQISKKHRSSADSENYFAPYSTIHEASPLWSPSGTPPESIWRQKTRSFLRPSASFSLPHSPVLSAKSFSPEEAVTRTRLWDGIADRVENINKGGISLGDSPRGHNRNSVLRVSPSSGMKMLLSAVMPGNTNSNNNSDNNDAATADNVMLRYLSPNFSYKQHIPNRHADDSKSAQDDNSSTVICIKNPLDGINSCI